MANRNNRRKRTTARIDKQLTKNESGPAGTEEGAAENVVPSASAAPMVVEAKPVPSAGGEPVVIDEKKDNAPIIDALLAEYNIVHERVLRQVTLYEETNVKILMLIGVLIFFGITNFRTKDYYIGIFVNTAFLVALPFIAICSVLLSLADLVKVMVLGDYLKIIEDKINKVLIHEATELKFCRGRVMDWEYWRIKHGHAKGFGALSEISFSLIIVLLSIFVACFCVSIRMQYIQTVLNDMHVYQLYYNVLVGFGIAMLAALLIFVIGFFSRRAKTNRNVVEKEHNYV